MMEAIFNQSGAELKMKDGGRAHESATMLETALRRTWDRFLCRQKCHATSKSILTVSCGPKRSL